MFTLEKNPRFTAFLDSNLHTRLAIVTANELGLAFPLGTFPKNLSRSVHIFTARCYASSVLAMALCPSVSVCVCLSVTSRSSTKKAKRRITQTTPHDSSGTLVFCFQRSPRNSTGVTPYGGAKCRWRGSKSATSTNNRLYLENGKR